MSGSYRTYLLKGLARCCYCGYPLWAAMEGRPKAAYFVADVRTFTDCDLFPITAQAKAECAL